MKSVLVTGATGFLGQKLCYELKNRGFSVTGIARNKEIGAELLQNGINFVEVDISDFDLVKKVFQNQHFVIHCAALSSLWGKYEDFYKANVIGAKSVVEACLSNNIQRLIHISTPSLYVNSSDQINIKESDPLPKKMINNYAKTKFLAEKIIDEAFTRGLPTIILRPRAIFGEGDTTLMPRLIKANQTMGIPLINGGAAMIDLTYVDNVIEAIILALNSPKNSLGKKYNISNGEPISLVNLFTKLFSQIQTQARFKKVNFTIAFSYAAILELIAKISRDKEPTLTKYSILALGKSMTLNIDEARKYLGYEPKISLEEGILKYTKWWKEKND